MKKLLALVIAVVYISSTVGATVHLHYCMDKLINWSLTGKDNDECEKCGMEKDGGCCKEDQKFIKNNTDQRTAKPTIQLLENSALVIPVPVISESALYLVPIERYPINHPPPPDAGIDILIHNCVFRI